MNIPQKAIEYIENETLVNFEDIENKMYDTKYFTQEESKRMCEMLIEVYEVVHSANKNHSCYDVHKDWRDKYLK